MKSGTWTCKPVSSTAIFCTLFAESPFTPSAYSTIFSVTVAGGSMSAAFSSVKMTSQARFSVR